MKVLFPEMMQATNSDIIETTQSHIYTSGMKAVAGRMGKLDEMS
jgi:hypothetical protein